MKIRLSSLTLAAALLLAALCGHPARAQKGGTTPSYTFTDLGGLPGLTNRGMPYTNSQAYAINAAIALEYQLTLVTRNTEDYKDIPDLKLYKAS